MIFVLVATTRGDALIPPTNHVLGASPYKVAVDTAKDKYIALRDKTLKELTTEQLPPWTMTNIYEKYEIIEAPDLSSI